MAFNGQGRPPLPNGPRMVHQNPQMRTGPGLPGLLPGMAPGAGLIPTPPMAMGAPILPMNMMNPGLNLNPALNNPHLAPLIQRMRSLPQFSAAAALHAAQMQNIQMAVARNAQMLQNRLMTPQQMAAQAQQAVMQLASQQQMAAMLPVVSAAMTLPQVQPEVPVTGQMALAGQMQAVMTMAGGQMPPGFQAQVAGQMPGPGHVQSPKPDQSFQSTQSQPIPGQSMGHNYEQNQPSNSEPRQDAYRNRDYVEQERRNWSEGDRSDRRGKRDEYRNQRFDSRRERDLRERDRGRSPRDEQYRSRRDYRHDYSPRHGRDDDYPQERSSESRENDPSSERSRDRNRRVEPSWDRSRSESRDSRAQDYKPRERQRESERSRDSDRLRDMERQRDVDRPRDLPRDAERGYDRRRDRLSVPQDHSRKKTRDRSPDRSPPGREREKPPESASDERYREEEVYEDDEEINIGEEIWREMRFGDSGEEEEIDLNEESQDVLSKEKAYIEHKAAKKRQQEEEEERAGSPIPQWIRSCPADIYFKREREMNRMLSTKHMCSLEERFEKDLVCLSEKVRATKPKYEPPPRPNPIFTHHHKHNNCSHGKDQSCSDSSSEESSDDEVELTWMDELNRKQMHPERLHPELWFNEKGEMNDGPLCRCSLKSRKSGIRHNIYPGEQDFPACDKYSNNANKLHHYRIAMSPHTNFLTKNPTIIEHDSHEYIFEGFSIFSHKKLENIPVCKVIRFNIEYTIHWFEEDIPDNFDVKSLDLFMDYLFYEILELVDLDWKPSDQDHCSRFHLMPRFVRGLPDNGKEILSMNEVLLYLLRSSRPLLEREELPDLIKLSKHEWQDMVDKVRGMIVTYPGMRPSSIRIDQLDREQMSPDGSTYPIIIHFGIRPAQLSYAGDPNYQKLWKTYVKFKHLLANKPKVTLEDKQKLMIKEEQLQEMRTKSNMKREVTVELSAEGFLKTGIRSDVCQHAMLLPVLISHLRFHRCLDVLEDAIQYQFQDRMLLQLALTHPSYRVNFGTNPDHARNSLSNCGIRQPEYGDSKIHHVNTRKRGINILINIMSRLGRKEETQSEINHYERLEFLGDAVVEFLSSIHLFFMFPSLEEGGLATYRAAIVQNQHLAVLAKKLKLQEFMLYAHGPDLCHESDLRHAMANCLEALMGALYLDGEIDLADRVYGEVLFDDDPDLLSTWMNLPPHPLQEDEPFSDRHWISSSPALQKLVLFEEDTGLHFNHIRLLARSFTMRNVGYNNLTFGHNQRLEFLGDTVLQLVASAYLFKHFPEHHEGHLSLLRSSLVNNRTQAVVCDDLGMTEYIIHADTRTLDPSGMKHKEKADLLEALIGALYVDKDLESCEVFCHVCFFPRLKMFIMNQDWNDPKSQLQQCCLTLRDLDGGEPDIPTYKVIASTGPTNTRKYTVAVYFRGERLATGIGHSIQQAEMNAATNALQDKADLFPQLQHQKRFIEKKYKKKKRKDGKDGLKSRSGRAEKGSQEGSMSKQDGLKSRSGRAEKGSQEGSMSKQDGLKSRSGRAEKGSQEGSMSKQDGLKSRSGRAEKGSQEGSMSKQDGLKSRIGRAEKGSQEGSMSKQDGLKSRSGRAEKGSQEGSMPKQDGLKSRSGRAEKGSQEGSMSKQDGLKSRSGRAEKGSQEGLMSKQDGLKSRSGRAEKGSQEGSSGRAEKGSQEGSMSKQDGLKSCSGRAEKGSQEGTMSKQERQ